MGELHAPRRGAWWCVALLAALLIVSFLDRSIISLLIGPIKRDLLISDQSIGFLYGTTFAIFYGAFSIPAAIWADSRNRKWLIVLGVGLWSNATVASGFAVGFTMLLFCRTLLAAGEASLSPAASSLIADYFPRERRVLPHSIYALSTQLGAHGSLIIGGLIIRMLGSGSRVNPPIIGPMATWQAVFLLVAIPAVLLCLLFALTVKEPRRRERRAQGGFGAVTADALAYMRNNGRLVIGYYGAIALLSTVAFSVSAWGPEFLQRRFDVTSARAGVAFGGAALIGGIFGTFGPARLSQMLRRRGWFESIPVVSVVLGLGSAIAAYATFNQITMHAFLPLLSLTLFLLVGGMLNLMIGLHVFLPNPIIASMTAVAGLCTTMVGLGLGPSIVAWLAATWFGGHEGLGPALASLAAVFGLAAAMLLLWSRKDIGREIASALEIERRALTAVPAMS